MIKLIDHAIFESHLNYSLPLWAEDANSVKILLVFQKKSQELSIFLERNLHSANLLKNLNVLKLPDKVAKYINQSLPKTSKNWITLAAASHTYNTRCFTQLALK